MNEKKLNQKGAFTAINKTIEIGHASPRAGNTQMPITTTSITKLHNMDIIDNQSASNSQLPQPPASNGEERNSNLKLISVGNTGEGLGIKLSKSSWDPYPFVSFVDETRTQQHDLQIGDCLLKVWNNTASDYEN